jgi:hypothetical protein
MCGSFRWSLLFSVTNHHTALAGATKVTSRSGHSSVPSSLSVPTHSDEYTSGTLPTPRSEGDILSSPNLKASTFSELKNATRNFRTDSLLGEGGFGNVYKGWIDEHTLGAERPGCGMVVAVKQLKPEGFQGHKEWLVGFFVMPLFSFCLNIWFGPSIDYCWLQSEVNHLGQLHHPNLVKLIGYCLEGNNLLLVYEYMPKGSLENHLFRSTSIFLVKITFNNCCSKIQHDIMCGLYFFINNFLKSMDRLPRKLF